MSNAYSPGWQSQEYHQLSRTQRAAISSFPCCRQPELGSEELRRRSRPQMAGVGTDEDN